MSSPEIRKPRVAIVGAGLTGLLVGHGLQKNGFEVAIFDRESSIDARLRDWTIVLHWAMPTMAKLLPEATLADLSKAICNPYLEFDKEVEALPCYNGVTGDLLFTSPLPGSRRVSRQNLRKVLAKGLRIHWGKALTQLSYPTDDSAQLTFQDESVYDVDYVLGADGASSKVREILVGPEVGQVQGSGFMFATCIVNYHDASKVEAVVKAHPVAAITLGSNAGAGCGVMYVDNPDDKSTWTTFWVKFWPGSPVNLQGQDALTYLKENTKGLCEPFQSLVDWTPDDSTCYIDEMKYWVPVPFNNHGGRVTLAGDAAHPMLIYRGQGFQHAITDANNYLDALLKLRNSGGGATLREEAITAYDTEMIERGGKAVTQSLREAENSIDLETVGKMLMARQGHGRSA
ncbi:Transient receptor potential cation channel subfamily M member 4 [Pleurostoma richardsiae]|uniref:Transient receptor potential cation channel subfamily M member 4 n=1 Tax=Pleurostoma richardsiae TaxID=41990 RepID=A0AA38VW75_9PEZI|nr:Transient receptor potential cation channel subfamily M member 4 [Pleurostoma richardsiae]